MNASSLQHWATRVAPLFVAASLAACGGDDDSTAAAPSPAPAPATASVTLTGTAAVGAAIAGADVKVTNANGVSATAKTGSDGKFSVSVAAAPPYLLNVTDSKGKTWFSYAAQAGVANITPLTTLALSKAYDNKPLASLLETWATNKLGSDTVLEAAKKLNANFKELLAAQELNFATYNVFTQPFEANSTGIDKLLDNIAVNFDCTATRCTETVKSPAGTTVVTWDNGLATTGISFSFTSSDGGTTTGGTVAIGACKAPVAGTFSMVVNTTVSGVGVPIPEVCVDGLASAPASDAEFCGNDSFKSQLPPGVSIVGCTFSGGVGTYNVRITSPITLDYTVKYTFIRR